MSDIYLSLTETPAVVTLSQPVIASSVAATVTVGNTVTVALDANSLSALENVTVTVGAAVSVSNFPASQVVSVSNLPASQTVQGTVTVASLPAISGSVTVNNFPSTQTIAGTVTANAVLAHTQPIYELSEAYADRCILIGTATAENGQVFHTSPDNPMPIAGMVTVGNSVTIGSLPAISGTVTANVPALGSAAALGASPIAVIGQNQNSPNPSHGIQIGYISDISGTFVNVQDNGYQQLPVKGTVTIGSCVTHGVRLQDASGNNLTSTSIGGVQRLNVSLASAATPGGSIPSFVNVYGGSDGSAVRTISVDSTGRQNTNPQFPRVTFIDGSGTVTTANTAITVFASSSTRSYLLVQVTTGSAFVNVGATATTVNGLSLTAGQGYSWETTIPQGVVSLISTTTSSRWVAKEA